MLLGSEAASDQRLFTRKARQGLIRAWCSPESSKGTDHEQSGSLKGWRCFYDTVIFQTKSNTCTELGKAGTACMAPVLTRGRFPGADYQKCLGLLSALTTSSAGSNTAVQELHQTNANMAAAQLSTGLLVKAAAEETTEAAVLKVQALRCCCGTDDDS
jgi:hypothetical protein